MWLRTILHWENSKCSAKRWVLTQSKPLQSQNNCSVSLIQLLMSWQLQNAKCRELWAVKLFVNGPFRAIKKWGSIWECQYLFIYLIFNKVNSFRTIRLHIQPTLESYQLLRMSSVVPMACNKFLCLVLHIAVKASKEISSDIANCNEVPVLSQVLMQYK